MSDPRLPSDAVYPSARKPDRTLRTIAVVVGLLIVAGALFELITAWPRADATALRSLCRANLTEIGTALERYAAQHGAYPPNLLELVERDLLVVETLRCPVRASAGGELIQYYYVRGLKPSDPPEWLLAFDAPLNHPEGGSVLYLSSIAVTLDGEAFEQELTRFRAAYLQSRMQVPQVVANGQVIDFPQ